MPTISSASTACQRIAESAAREAIQQWLHGLNRAGLYTFEVDGVECALEFFRGHWDGGGRTQVLGQGGCG